MLSSQLPSAKYGSGQSKGKLLVASVGKPVGFSNIGKHDNKQIASILYKINDVGGTPKIYRSITTVKG